MNQLLSDCLGVLTSADYLLQSVAPYFGHSSSLGLDEAQAVNLDYQIPYCLPVAAQERLMSLFSSGAFHLIPHQLLNPDHSTLIL